MSIEHRRAGVPPSVRRGPPASQLVADWGATSATEAAGRGSPRRARLPSQQRKDGDEEEEQGLQAHSFAEHSAEERVDDGAGGADEGVEAGDFALAEARA